MSDNSSSAPSDFPTPAEFRDELARRGRRGVRVGAVVGVAVVVLLVGLAVVLFDIDGSRPGRSAWAFVPTAVQLAMLIVVAAGLGRMQASLWATQLLRDAAGERTVAARVRKVVFKGRAPLNEHEQVRAVIWAPLAAVYLRYQAVSSAIFLTPVTVNSFVQAATGPSDAPALHAVQWVVAIGLVVIAAVTAPLQARHIRLAACYPDHPHPAVL